MMDLSGVAARAQAQTQASVPSLAAPSPSSALPSGGSRQTSIGHGHGHGDGKLVGDAAKLRRSPFTTAQGTRQATQAAALLPAALTALPPTPRAAAQELAPTSWWHDAACVGAGGLAGAALLGASLAVAPAAVTPLACHLALGLGAGLPGTLALLWFLAPPADDGDALGGGIDLSWPALLGYGLRVGATTLAGSVEGAQAHLRRLVHFGLGLGLAPLPLAAAAVHAGSGAVALACTAGAAVTAYALRREAAAQPLPWADAFTFAAATATAPLAWAVAAGTAPLAALTTAACCGQAVLVAAALAQFALGNAGQMVQTPYADSHVVPRQEVARVRAEGFGEAAPNLYDVPPAVTAKLAAAMRHLRYNPAADPADGPSWLGLPVLTLEGAPGTGKTTLAHAIAQKLDADLLVTSASLLGRAHLRGQPVGLLRLVTLLGQAELRAIRYRRLQVVFVDEMGALFPQALDLTSLYGLNEARTRLQAMMDIATQNARRNGVLLLLAANDAQASRTALLTFSPQRPVVVQPPSARQLGRIFADKWRLACADLASKWQSDLFGHLAHDRTLLDLAEVAVAHAYTGRDVAGAVGRMRRVAEASQLDLADAQASTPVTSPTALVDALADAGRQALIALGATSRGGSAAPSAVVSADVPTSASTSPTSPASPASAAAAAPALDTALLRRRLRDLLGQGLARPHAVLGELFAQQASNAVDARQYLDRQRIFAAYEKTTGAISDRRFTVDLNATAAYFHAVYSDADPAAAAGAILAPTTEATAEAAEVPFFADVTLPTPEFGAYLLASAAFQPWPAAEDGALATPPARGTVAYYQQWHPLERFYVGLSERFAGLRQDAWRSECALHRLPPRAGGVAAPFFLRDHHF